MTGIRKVVVVFLCLHLSTAWADWVQIFSTDNGDSYFIDPSSQKGDEVRRVWTKVNFGSPQSFGALSVRSLEEFHCKEEKSRVVQFSAFSAVNLDGVVVNSSRSKTPWDLVVPETTRRKLFQAVCKD